MCLSCALILISFLNVLVIYHSEQNCILVTLSVKADTMNIGYIHGVP